MIGIKLKRLFLILFLFCIGCAGPTSPFGGLSIMSLSKKLDFHLPDEENKTIKFSVSPERQVMHKSSPIKITIHDYKPITDYQLHVYYNGRDVTQKMLENAKIRFSPDRQQVTYLIAKATISSRKKSSIVFNYDNGEQKVYYEYKKPSCDYLQKEDEVVVSHFEPPNYMMKYIKNWALYYGYNPNLIAGIIAQESMFNPKAVSWAKAIGLMQITPIADKELQDDFASWPRNGKIESLPAPVLKLYIYNGQINEKNDWRLDIEKSIRGGIGYFKFVDKYWKLDRHQKLLANRFKLLDIHKINVLLASYNSGASRVKRAILGYNENFLDSPDLREARNYVHRVNSFCYSFNKEL